MLGNSIEEKTVNQTVVQIARIKAGRFEAYFDRVGDQWEVSMEWMSTPAGTFRFDTEESARKYWHQKVIDQKGFLHCYCC